MKDLSYNKHRAKSVLFFSAASVADCNAIMDRGIFEILVSFHYLQKRQRAFEEEILPRIYDSGGLFMTDSGAFSFFSSLAGNTEATKADYWIPYIEKYTEWLDKFSKYIYVCANMDLDNFVGREAVDLWNTKYFKPLEQSMNVSFLAHADQRGKYNDPTGLKRVEQYLKRFDYIGVNQNMKPYANKVFYMAKKYKKRVHGFAWTDMELIKRTPMFSVDSSTWSAGQRFGATFNYDGKNFKRYETPFKYRRRLNKIRSRDIGVNYDALIQNDNEALRNFNLEAWKGGRSEYIKVANTKLWNKPVSEYAR